MIISGNEMRDRLLAKISKNSKYGKMKPKPTTGKALRQASMFRMTKTVERKQAGRGSRFQNHKITVYHISPSIAHPIVIEEASKLIGSIGYAGRDLAWNFLNRRDADKAWITLILRFGE